MTIDRELLFKPRLPEADVELDLEGIGRETFRVRALSRAEAIKVQKLEGKGVLAVERKILALGLVDPEMTAAEVERWQQACPAGELDPLTLKISELSGLDVGAAKAAYKEMASDPDAEFRDVPGRDVGHDRGPDGD